MLKAESYRDILANPALTPWQRRFFTAQLKAVDGYPRTGCSLTTPKQGLSHTVFSQMLAQIENPTKPADYRRRHFPFRD